MSHSESAPNTATFILSTGRCGTQWIASALGNAFADLLQVTHEPLHNQYEPRTALSAKSCSSVVSAHFDQIEQILENQSYLECGHPAWSSLPYFAARLPGRIRIVHLTRHPVPCSYSWLTHGAYQAPLLPHIPSKILLSPFDEGIRFPEYREEWEALSAFEKCIYYWSEVNAFALDLQSQLDIPWLRLRYEDLFEGGGLAALLDFLNLPPRMETVLQRSDVVDRFHYLAGEWDDWRVIQKHPATLELAKELGYDFDEIDELALRQRYLGATSSR